MQHVENGVILVLRSLSRCPTSARLLPDSTVTRGDGAVVSAGGSLGLFPPTNGANTDTIDVTTTDNQTKTFKVVVIRAPGAAVSPYGVHLGGGVWLVRTGTFSHLKVTRAAASTTAKPKKKQSVRTPLNRLVAPRCVTSPPGPPIVYQYGPMDRGSRKAPGALAAKASRLCRPCDSRTQDLSR